MLPSFTSIRLEAVWTVEIAYVRYARKIVAHLMKALKPTLKGAFMPSRTGSSGYEVKVRFLSMEETDPEGDWPEW